MLEDGSGLTLTPSPTFLDKNEHEGELIVLIRIQSFLRNRGPHPSCPVWEFRDYNERTEGLSEDHLFYNLKSLKTFSLGQWHASYAASLRTQSQGTHPVPIASTDWRHHWHTYALTQWQESMTWGTEPRPLLSGNVTSTTQCLKPHV